MSRQGSYWRLIKKINGTVSVLWERGLALTQRRVHMLVVDCVGDRVAVYLNGLPVFSVQDGDLAAGRIGLYCWRNPGARFSEVRVSPPTWTPYYVFGQEARFPASTRVQIFAGSEADAPEEGEPGVARRFLASPGEPSRLRLPMDGADMRLVAPDGAAGHIRTFLPLSAYTPVPDVRILRKADGTGFFMLMPAGPGLAAGQYRLAMTYRRDNRGPAPDSQVFSEAGNRTPEGVTIEIPWQVHQ
jgi:hypothetical protein